MIGDILLRLLGENPDSPDYYDTTEKWVGIIHQSSELSRVILPIILPATPLVWLMWKKRKGSKPNRKDIVIAVVVSCLMFIVSFYIPDLIDEIMAGIGVQQLYGDVF